MSPFIRLYKNPWVMGTAIGLVIFSGLDKNFISFFCGTMGLCCLYTGWWLEQNYYPEYKGDDV